MRTDRLFTAIVLLALATAAGIRSAGAEPSTTNVRLPIYFEANGGQFDAAVTAAARTDGYTAFFTADRIVLAVAGGPEHASLAFAGGARVKPATLAPREGRIHYLVGPSAQWHRDIATFARVRYEETYPGIDVEFYAAGDRLEYDFLVAPGADPSRIALALRGDAVPAITSGGDLELRVGGGVLTHHEPVAYQMVNGQRAPVTAAYRIDRTGHVRLDVGAYDRTRPLVIDPLLSYSSAFAEAVRDIAVDAAGQAYLTGWTENPDFPTTPGAYDRTHGGGVNRPDGFVAKLNASGTDFVYATFFGGSEIELVSAIAIDATGHAYVVGYTGSPDFPVTPGAWDTVCEGECGIDGFAIKFNPAGSGLVYATYIGGGDSDFAVDISVDAGGRAVVVGNTSSSDFPTTPGAFQATKPGTSPFNPGEGFVVRLNAAGTAVVYSTYFGGSFDDGLSRVTHDLAGNVFVLGDTGSPNIPVMAPVQPNYGGQTDIVMAKFRPSGSAILVTYLGGPQNELAGDVAVGGGTLYVLGHGTGGYPTSPTTTIGPGGQNDTFVIRLTRPGTAIDWSTVIGGSSFDVGQRLDLDEQGRLHVSGWTVSINLPVTPDAVQTNIFGESDAMYLTLNPTGTALVYGTYLGGGRDEVHAVLDVAGSDVWLAGATSSLAFPQVNAAGRIGAPGDTGWVARFDWDPPPPVNDPRELVLYAADADDINGAWRLVSDASAAAGRRLHHPNAGVPVTPPQAFPANFFDLTFTAEAGVAYRLWIRGRADSNHWSNDSVHVQFTGSVTASGAPTWRIGSASATTVQIENCTNCGLQGWGWSDNAFNGDGVLVRFATTGEQRIRIQTREDGIAVDQIVLSSSRYLTTAPGAAKVDSTILPPSDGSGTTELRTP